MNTPDEGLSKKTLAMTAKQIFERRNKIYQRRAKRIEAECSCNLCGFKTVDCYEFKVFEQLYPTICRRCVSLVTSQFMNELRGD